MVRNRESSPLDVQVAQDQMLVTAQRLYGHSGKSLETDLSNRVVWVDPLLTQPADIQLPHDLVINRAIRQAKDYGVAIRGKEGVIFKFTIRPDSVRRTSLGGNPVPSIIFMQVKEDSLNVTLPDHMDSDNPEVRKKYYRYGVNFLDVWRDAIRDFSMRNFG